VSYEHVQNHHRDRVVNVLSSFVESLEFNFSSDKLDTALQTVRHRFNICAIEPWCYDAEMDTFYSLQPTHFGVIRRKNWFNKRNLMSIEDFTLQYWLFGED